MRLISIVALLAMIPTLVGVGLALDRAFAQSASAAQEGEGVGACNQLLGEAVFANRQAAGNLQALYAQKTAAEARAKELETQWGDLDKVKARLNELEKSAKTEKPAEKLEETKGPVLK